MASYADTPEGGRQVDISHRGGRPGFVRVDGDVLTIPDFSGNRYFNTLGNLAANPRAGLLFIDFERGDTLQLSGPTELVLEGPEVASFEGAERLWRVRARRAVRRPGALALRWRFGDYAPTSLAAGSGRRRCSGGRVREAWRRGGGRLQSGATLRTTVSSGSRRRPSCAWISSRRTGWPRLRSISSECASRGP